MSDRLKLRVVNYEGEELEFYCTDAELEEFLKPDVLDMFWWQRQSPEFQADWTDASTGMKTEDEIRELKRQMYSAREVERRAGVHFGEETRPDYSKPT